MQPFHINVPAHEYEAVLITLSSIRDPISVRDLSYAMGIHQNRLRYILDELVKNNRIRKVPIDARPHHKRYRYEVASI